MTKNNFSTQRREDAKIFFISFLCIFASLHLFLKEMNKINYNHRTFKSVSNSATGEVSGETVFHYHQKDALVWAEYEGGAIVFGQIVGKVLDDNSLEFCYQHLNEFGELMTGKCTSVPEVLADGKIRLHEKWEWTCKDFSKGISTLEEI